MFKLVWARSRGRGRTHRPGPGSGRLGKREAAEGRSRGVAAPRARGARWLRCSAVSAGSGEGGMMARPGRVGQGGSARAPDRAVSASPPSQLYILGTAKRRAPRSPAARLPCSGSLAGRDGAAARRRASRGGRPHPRGPRPRSGLEAAPGPRPRPPPLPAAPFCCRAPRRAHGSGGGTAAFTSALARSPARSLSRPPALRAPGSGVPSGATARGAALFPMRRRPGSSLALPRRVGATSWPRSYRAPSRGCARRRGMRMGLGDHRPCVALRLSRGHATS